MAARRGQRARPAGPLGAGRRLRRCLPAAALAACLSVAGGAERSRGAPTVTAGGELLVGAHGTRHPRVAIFRGVPFAAGLFRRLIRQSGGSHMLEGLRLVDVERVAIAIAAALPDYYYSAVVDGISLDRPPAASYRAGLPAEMLSGSNENEWYMYLDHDPAARADLEAAAARGPGVRRGHDLVVTLANLDCPAYAMAAAATAGRLRASMYRFSRVRPGPAARRRRPTTGRRSRTRWTPPTTGSAVTRTTTASLQRCSATGATSLATTTRTASGASRGRPSTRTTRGYRSSARASGRCRRPTRRGATAWRRRRTPAGPRARRLCTSPPARKHRE